MMHLFWCNIHILYVIYNILDQMVYLIEYLYLLGKTQDKECAIQTGKCKAIVSKPTLWRGLYYLSNVNTSYY